MSPTVRLGHRVVPGLLLGALGAIVLGCGGRTASDYDRAFAESRRASSAGRSAEASEAYARAAKSATNDRDRDHAMLLAALEKARAGNLADALRELDTLAQHTPSTRTSEEAAFKAADLRRKSGSPTEGLEALRTFVMSHPASPFALPALAHLMRAEEASASEPREAAARSQALLAKLAEKVPESSPVGQKIAYERAKGTEPKEARVKAYLALASRFPYPRGAYWDDSLFAAANLEVEAERPREAIAILTRLLAERETSDLIGTYQRPKYTPAKLRIAEIQAEKLHDHEAARRTLHELYTTFTTSDLRDDALWREAKLFREDHRDDDACRVLRTLVSDFPDSRYVPCAVASCPGMERPKKSRSPATCRAYLTRDEAAKPSSEAP